MSKEKIAYKQRLKEYCLSVIQQRMDIASEGMKDAQDAANSEEKSSAGDKYETSRAMNQTIRDNYAHQLSVAVQDMNLLKSINTDKLYEQADNGAVIHSEDAIYFIATGLGIITFEGAKVVVLSPRAPLSALLRDKTKGEELNLNGKAITITDIF